MSTIEKAARAVPALLAALALAVGCVQLSLPREATPEQRYYAGLSDWNLAKRALVAWVREPSTPIEYGLAAAEFAAQVDSRVAEFEALRARPGGALPSDYELAASALLYAAHQARAALAARAGEEQHQ